MQSCFFVSISFGISSGYILQISIFGILFLHPEQGGTIGFHDGASLPDAIRPGACFIRNCRSFSVKVFCSFSAIVFLCYTSCDNSVTVGFYDIYIKCCVPRIQNFLFHIVTEARELNAVAGYLDIDNIFAGNRVPVS